MAPLRADLISAHALHALGEGSRSRKQSSRRDKCMTDEPSFFGRLWAKQHGKQYAITAVTAGSSGALLVLFGIQLLFLQDSPTWGDTTGLALVGAVLALFVLLFSFPEFLRFRGHVLTIEETMAIQSTAELRRSKADATASAEALGAGHLERWNAFLQERGLRR